MLPLNVIQSACGEHCLYLMMRGMGVSAEAGWVTVEKNAIGVW